MYIYDIYMQNHSHVPPIDFLLGRIIEKSANSAPDDATFYRLSNFMCNVIDCYHKASTGKNRSLEYATLDSFGFRYGRPYSEQLSLGRLKNFE